MPYLLPNWSRISAEKVYGWLVGKFQVTCFWIKLNDPVYYSGWNFLFYWVDLIFLSNTDIGEQSEFFWCLMAEEEFLKNILAEEKGYNNLVDLKISFMKK